MTTTEIRKKVIEYQRGSWCSDEQQTYYRNGYVDGGQEITNKVIDNILEALQLNGIHIAYTGQGKVVELNVFINKFRIR